jgi:hypothetical protein
VSLPQIFLFAYSLRSEPLTLAFAAGGLATLVAGGRQGEAWLRAVAQVQALGMLDGGCRFLLDRRSSALDTHADFKVNRIPPTRTVRLNKPGVHSG